VTVLIFVITAGLTFVNITNLPSSTIGLFQGMAALLIMSYIAYFDHFSGRILLSALICSTLFGLVVFLIDKHALNYLNGGVTNLVISLAFYYFGIQYVQKNDQMNDEKPVFGLGDVYGLRALRFMLGLPDSLWGLLLTHI